MQVVRATFLSFVIVGLGLQSASAQLPVRTDVPIRDVPLSNGLHLYSIPIKVGGTEIEAGLDTGSPGLRVFPGTLAATDVQQGGSVRDANFSSGVRYEGSSATGILALGGASGSVRLETINVIECQSDRPNCPATRISATDYGVRGDSLTGGRFRAVIGINTAQADIRSPLLQLGINRWIVTLPRSGEIGHLILNPTDEETNGFVQFQKIAALRDRGSLRDAIEGCIFDDQKHSNCGPLLMDSGAPTIHLINGSAGDALIKGAQAALAFTKSGQAVAAEQFVVGQPENGTVFRADADRAMRSTTIIAGTAPFLAFDVLYDANSDEIWLRPRQPSNGGPIGQVLNSH